MSFSEALNIIYANVRKVCVPEISQILHVIRFSQEPDRLTHKIVRRYLHLRMHNQRDSWKTIPQSNIFFISLQEYDYMRRFGSVREV